MAIDRDALLIVRAWVEPESAEPLRARIHIADDSETGYRVVILSRPDQVERLVARWIQDVLHPH